MFCVIFNCVQNILTYQLYRTKSVYVYFMPIIY